ncbi:GntR family transcriptional regulator [Microbacterium sp.]|uniref:GntR family transcriptional regulator n=1 Tax=Microbacterium sp. TaxID=51671 RepID=UPI002C1F18A2|nr:GntR family transcriptional regulator [Microbacterium sp.]HWL77650.1 GntR family transcriptional regulator [Microbacterium sp.]
MTVPVDSSEYVSPADRIVTTLQRRVVSGEIAIGTWLRHDALAAEFGVSRTPVREALRVLAAQGIVTIAPNRGARVNGLSVRDIREMGEVRAELQGLAAELAAIRINDDQITRLFAAWDEFREALEHGASSDDLGDLWADANERFHSVVVEAADNRQLALTIAELHRRVPRNLSFGGYAGNTHRLRVNLAEHDEIARAIADHDPVRARELTEEHYRKANESTARWVETRLSEQGA